MPLATPWTAQVSPTNALPDYPRPQLARPSAASPEWTNLNGLWQFAQWDGFSAVPFGQNLSGKVLVPYPIESALSGVQKHYDYMLYRRTIDVPESYPAPRRRVDNVRDPWERQLDGHQRSAAQAGRVPPMSLR